MKIDNYKKDIEIYLKDYFKDRDGYNKLIYDASSYSLNIGGKRIRPILLILTYGLYKEKAEEVIPMAAAVEMIHTYSLIHDDLPCMDNDDIRRGKLTNHKVYGENIAVLAGDALLNEAMIIMMNFSLNHGIEALKASSIIAEAAGANGMIGGQVVDILAEEKEEITEDELKYMHLKKTGELIRSSILAGATLGEAPEEDKEKLDLFGKKLGLAFQIKDDILDVIGNAEQLGKNINRDEDKNKCNFITMYGIDKCEYLCKKLTEECIDILNTLTVKATYLKDLTFSLLNREY